MSKTRDELLSDSRILIGQTDSSNSDFTDDELVDFIDEAVKYVATVTKTPRTHDTITPVLGTTTYSIFTSQNQLLGAYFGNPATQGDMEPMAVVTEEKLTEMYPGWLETASGNYDRPKVIMMKDKDNMLIYPPPNAEQSATGKVVYVLYSYYPAALSAGTSVPDIYEGYHDFVKLYVGHLCYLGKLKNSEKAAELLKELTLQLKLVSPQIEEVSEMYFGWCAYDNLNTGMNAGNIGEHKLI